MVLKSLSFKLLSHNYFHKLTFNWGSVSVIRTKNILKMMLMKQGWHDAHSTQAAESSPAILGGSALLLEDTVSKPQNLNLLL